MPRRVLVVTTSYPRFRGDASGHFVEAEVKKLVEQGDQVDVLAAGIGDRGVSSGNVRFLGGTGLFRPPGAIQRLKESPLRAGGFLTATCSLLRQRTAYDQIIAHWLIPSAFPWALALPTAGSLLVVAHGSDIELLLRLPAPARNLILRALRRRDAQLRFVSRDMRNRLLHVCSGPLQKYLVRSSTVEPALLSLPPLPDVLEARTQLAQDPRRRLSLFVGRLIEEKRPRAALSAASLVAGLDCVVIGEGPLRASLEKEFPEAVFLGQLSRPQTLLWLRAADLLISSSRLEGAPTAVREALALGTSVVSANVGDLEEWALRESELYLFS